MTGLNSGSQALQSEVLQLNSVPQSGPGMLSSVQAVKWKEPPSVRDLYYPSPKSLHSQIAHTVLSLLGSENSYLNSLNQWLVEPILPGKIMEKIGGFTETSS